MANELTQVYDLPKDSYVAFDAISLRNLIIKRLNDQGLITDQNYIGSNLASIIDIISYSFNSLIFYLNRTSSESTFTEAQLYESINKIVKLLDYKPIGYQTSTLTVECSAVVQMPGASPDLPVGSYTIPRYSYVLVGDTSYSFNEDITFAITQDGIVFDSGSQTFLHEITEITNRKLLYQGIYREYTQQVAAGDPGEMIVVNVANTLIDHFNLDVYVYEKENEQWIQYKQLNSLYGEKATSRSFEKRLNSEYLYEITFGDGINGRKLQTGDLIQIYFLQSSGGRGVVGPRATSISTSTNYYVSPILNEILVSTNIQNVNYLTPSQLGFLKYDNFTGSTIPKDVENAESIRLNAPRTFKSQYRLVTAGDFEAYARTNFSHFLNDVKVFTNWDYTGKYLKYFYDLGLRPERFKQIMFNQVTYADACNFNNIYVCGIPRVSPRTSVKYLLPSQKEVIKASMDSLKPLTSEITFMDPIVKAVSLGFISAISTTGAVDITTSNMFNILVTQRRDSSRTSESLKRDVLNVFGNFFNPINIKLGDKFDYITLYNQLINLEGVKGVFTKKVDTNEILNGLSFFMWNPNYPSLDSRVVSSSLILQDFEVMYFDDLLNFENKIEIIKES